MPMEPPMLRMRLNRLVAFPMRSRGIGSIETVVNGTNYSSGETDRFKDYAARVTLTPFANDSSFFRTLTISPWYSMGQTASAFVLPPNAISEGLQRDRRGLFVGLRERRLTGGGAPSDGGSRPGGRRQEPPGRLHE